MKILLVSATHKEVEGLIGTLENLKSFNKDFSRGFIANSLIDVIVTGVGPTATADCLSSFLQDSRYDLVLNLGICGSFRKEYPIGSVVNITSEIWGDLGAEDHEEFLDLFDLEILKIDEKPFTGKHLVNEGNKYSALFAHLPKVKGVSVNTVHGRQESIEKCILKYNPDVESMEGAAIFSFCKSHGINFQCLRSISNFVGPRNREAWDIVTALQNLTLEINRIISVIRK